MVTEQTEHGAALGRHMHAVSRCAQVAQPIEVQARAGEDFLTGATGRCSAPVRTEGCVGEAHLANNIECVLWLPDRKESAPAAAECTAASRLVATPHKAHVDVTLKT